MNKRAKIIMTLYYITSITAIIGLFTVVVLYKSKVDSYEKEVPIEQKQKIEDTFKDDYKLDIPAFPENIQLKVNQEIALIVHNNKFAYEVISTVRVYEDDNLINTAFIIWEFYSKEEVKEKAYKDYVTCKKEQKKLMKELGMIE